MPPNIKDIGINMEPLEFTCTNKAEYGKTTLMMVGIQKIRLVARTNKGEGDVLVDKTVEVPLTVDPDTFNIAHLADNLSMEVSGPVTCTETSGENSRNDSATQRFDFRVPYPSR